MNAGCAAGWWDFGHGPCGAFLAFYYDVGAGGVVCFYEPSSENLVGVIGFDDTPARCGDGGSSWVQAGQVDTSCGGLSLGVNAPPSQLPTTSCGQDAGAGSPAAEASDGRAGD